MNKARYVKYIIKKLENKISLRQKQQLDKWLDDNENHQQQYNLVSKIWNEGKNLEHPPLPDIDEQWNEMRQYVLKKQNQSQNLSLIEKLQQLIYIHPSRRFAFAFGVIFIIFCLSGWYLYDITTFTRIHTQNCQTTEINLADGSTVTMNSGSSIKFRKKFSENIRQLNLKGEAFFKIAKDNRPFTVITNNAKITVLGTQFNTWARNQKTRVVVKQGKVEFQSKQQSESAVVLTKGQKSQAIKNAPPKNPEDINVDHLLGWMKGILVFEKMPVTEIINELQFHYGKRIKLQNEELRQKTLTATFDKLSLTEVIGAICISLNIKYQYKNNTYILFTDYEN